MSPRKTALTVAVVALAAILFLWLNTPRPVEEARDQGEGEGTRGSPAASVPAQPRPDAPPTPESAAGAPKPLVSNATGSPIPFERLSVAGLEEVELADAGLVHSHKIREWRGRLEPALNDLQSALDREGEDGVLAISLPDATQVLVTRLRHEALGANQGVFTGKILGDTYGEVVLSYVNQAVAGAIHDYRNENVWEIRNAGQGQQYIAQVDVDALGECGLCVTQKQR